MMSSDLLVPTAERTLRLIELLLDHPEGLSPQELLPHLDLSRSSLFLLLRTLKSLGYIEQAERRGRYRPGPRLEAWRSSPAQSTKDLLTSFYQEAAHHALSETLALAIHAEGGPLLLGQVEGSRQVRSSFSAGQVYAGLKPVVQVLQKDPTAEVRANGYCLSAGDDAFELALPICRDGSRPDAALVLSAPRFRWQPEGLLDTFLPDLRMMAARLSYLIGAPAYTPYHIQSDTPIQPTASLTQDQITAFLQGPWAARLACVRPDGRPHVIPVWQEWDGDHFHVIAWQGSQWSEYLLQNPSVSLTVDEPWPPLRRVVVRGQAQSLEPDQGGLDTASLLDRMSRRYLGQAYSGQAGQVQRSFRIIPEYLRGWQGLPGGA
jgi:DNA-binding IclR family transcriptional regulator/nitroimidazol reductase NimA-like FMN-containing flavoprotein (pyridoxamine 5'-phosphate oxidase superfamily)